MNNVHSSWYLSAALTSTLLLPACAVELIDQIIAERGVTECTTGSGSESTTQGSSSDAVSTSSGAVGPDTSSDESEAATVAGSDTSGTTSGEETAGTSTGHEAVCGNGVVEAGEDCDDMTNFCNAACVKSMFVFVTSDPPLQAGAIDGLIGADYQCRHRAAVMNFPNAERYRAWISTSTVDARDRVEHHAGRYILVNGLIVAENWDAFASAVHQNPINVTEQSQTLVVGVWTGTQPDGTRVPAQSHCQDWTSSSALEKAYAGDSSFLDASWTLDQLINPIGCVSAVALYCIEQP
jgi:hypothetical protein